MESVSQRPLEGEGSAELTFEDRTYRKVILRILPILLLCYMAAYLDRVNIGFAKLDMLNDLQFSNTVYALGRQYVSSGAISCSKCRATCCCIALARASGSLASCSPGP